MPPYLVLAGVVFVALSGALAQSSAPWPGRALLAVGVVLIAIAATARWRTARHGPPAAGPLVWPYATIAVALATYCAGRALAPGDLRDVAGLHLALQILCFALAVAGGAVAAAMEWAWTPRTGVPLDPRRVSAFGRLALGVVVVFFAAVAINVGAARLDLRYDAGALGRLTPSAATLAVIETPGEAWKVELFFPPGNDVAAPVARYARRLAAQASTPVSWRRLDAAVDAAEARRFDVRANGIIAIGRGDRRETIELPLLIDDARARLARLDVEFLMAVRRISTATRRVYAVVEPDAPSLARFAGLVRRLDADVAWLEVVAVTRGVPPDADLVVLAGPTRPWPASAVAAVSRYSAAGGALLVLAEAPAGLDGLFEALGVEISSTRLVNTEAHVRLDRRPEDSRVLVADRITRHPAVDSVARGGRGVVWPGTGSVTRRVDAVAPARGGPDVRVLVETPAGTWADADGDLVWDEGEERRGTHALMIAVEWPSTVPGSRGGRAVVTADVDVISDRILRFSRANERWTLDVVAWLLGDRDGAPQGVTPPPPLPDADRPIVHTRNEDVAWFYGATLAVPALVLGVGLWRRRRLGP